MKCLKAICMLCLIIAASASGWAQKGLRAQNGAENRSGNCPMQPAAVLQPLNAKEAEHLLFLREEEKLARDVYRALYARWRTPIFSNIAASEQRHFEAVGILIERYGLPDLAQPSPGIFTNPELQKLYYDLIDKGRRSLPDALAAGVAIEEKDIDDLKIAINETDNKDVLKVYGNLLNGSARHLDAFNSRIDAMN